MPNLLFGVESHHHRLAILDWQGPLIAKGMFDVALLLGQNTKIEVRQKEEKQLLERYYKTLAQPLEQSIFSFYVSNRFNNLLYEILIRPPETIEWDYKKTL